MPKKGKRMTVGIGILCDSGNAIIIGADTRATAATGTFLESVSDASHKLFDVDKKVFCVSAGNISLGHMFFSEFASEIRQLDELKTNRLRLVLLCYVEST